MADTLIIEDGTGRPDAQSYASVSYFRGFAKARGVTVPQEDADCMALLTKGMDRLEDEEYQGDRWSHTQAFKWPRYGAIVEGWPVLSNEIPRQLIQAQCAFGIAAMAVDLLPTQDINASGAITEEVAGPVTTVYANNGIVRRVPAVASAETLLRTLLRRNGLTVIRS